MKKIILITALIAVVAGAYAQNGALTQSQKDTLKELKTISSDHQLAKNFTPFGNSALSNFISSFSLSSTLNKGVNGKVDLKYKFKNSLVAGIYADQKIGPDDNQASFVDFTKGVSPGTTVGLNIQKVFWSPQFIEEDRKELNALRIEYAKNHPEIKEPRMISKSDIMQNGTPEQKRKLADIQDDVNPVFFNFSFSFTKSSFSYATDSVSLSKIDANYLTPSIKLSLGFPFGKTFTSFFGINYIYAESYQAADDITFSSPFGTTANFISQTISFGKPVHQYDHKISLELRQSFGGSPADFAIDPSIIYGLKSKMIALSLPLYFIKGTTTDGKANGLQGGINLGYVTPTNSLSSFKNGFAAQLILTAPFNIFENL